MRNTMKTKAKAGQIDVVVGQNLRVIRLQNSLTQEQLADAVGVTFQQIQKYENGKNRISASMLLMLSRHLDAPLESFFDGMPRSKKSQFFTDKAMQVDKEFYELLVLYQKIPGPEFKKQIRTFLKSIAV